MSGVARLVGVWMPSSDARFSTRHGFRIDIEGTRIFAVPRDHGPCGIVLDLTTEHAIETILCVWSPTEPVRGCPISATAVWS